jgi:hypothetical protein
MFFRSIKLESSPDHSLHGYLISSAPATRTCKRVWVLQQMTTTDNFATDLAWTGDTCNNNHSGKREGRHMLKDLQKPASAWSLGPLDLDSILKRIEITM